MRIGIITFTYGDNYGQRLQNLAVQEILKRYTSEVYTISQIRPNGCMRAIIKRLITLLLRGEFTASIRRHNSFKMFDEAYISYFNVPISSKLSDEFPENYFDFFVAGSDQIWSPYSKDVNETMFLTFTDKEKRIALCPSIAAERFPKDKKAQYQELLEGFKYISIREERGAELVKDLIGVKPTVLIDPTLMLDKNYWSQYEKKPNKVLPEKYIFCYFLGSSSYKREIQEFAKKNKFEIIDILFDRKFQDAGPAEFLFLIRHAELVITDSYHGTIFSLIFDKPFVICSREGDSVNMESRFKTLEKKFLIKGHDIEKLQTYSINELKCESINEKLGCERQKVYSFLETAIGI